MLELPPKLTWLFSCLNQHSEIIIHTIFHLKKSGEDTIVICDATVERDHVHSPLFYDYFNPFYLETFYEVINRSGIFRKLIGFCL